jgi:O-acetyl-ADP-ribose deacetylase
MDVAIIEGDLLDQNVEVIVNAWNRNVIPWWLLLPQGVSGAIKRRGGTLPFKELARLGPIPLGHARLTSAGKLTYHAIIHVAGINLLWRSSKAAIQDCVKNAMALVDQYQFRSVAFPIIGSGSGGYRLEEALAIMKEQFASMHSTASAAIVRYNSGSGPTKRLAGKPAGRS